MPKVLIAALGRESLMYVRRCRLLGLSVRVLDCFDAHHTRLSKWHGADVLQVAARRSDVRAAVSSEDFDAAIVHEDADYVKTALVTQSLREAGVRSIIVVTRESGRKTLYRRCGAHRVVAAANVEQAWMQVVRYLPTFATA
jgi:Trk K+ transport system NAD-binding subunit